MNLFRNALLFAGLLFPGTRRKRIDKTARTEDKGQVLTWNGSLHSAGNVAEEKKETSAVPPQHLDNRIEIGRKEQTANHLHIPVLRKELFRDAPPAENLSPSSNSADNEWLQSISSTGEWRKKPLRRGTQEELEEQTVELFDNLYELLCNYARQFNTLVSSPVLKISMTDPDSVVEKKMVRKVKALTTVETMEQFTYRRWRLSTRSWSITGRAADGVIETFVIPASDVMLLSNGEHSFRRRMRLELRQRKAESTWLLDGLPAGTDDMRVLTRQMFKELVCSTRDQEQPLQQIGKEQMVDGALAGSINKLLEERQNLAQKVVIQQEDIQRRIARDLHDAVISDVMALKRSLNDEAPDPIFIAESLDTVVQRLRDICYELSPRDLGDWGLQVVLEDLLGSMAERTEADCVLNCDVEIPALPGAVELHVYRIVQECLNNVLKYARATKVVVTIEYNGTTLSVLVADNGKGFDPEQVAAPDPKSGYGITSIRERVELIRCFYPARLHIESTPGTGTHTLLELDLR